jgi:hypothetical protein
MPDCVFCGSNEVAETIKTKEMMFGGRTNSSTSYAQNVGVAVWQHLWTVSICLFTIPATIIPITHTSQKRARSRRWTVPSQACR